MLKLVCNGDNLHEENIKAINEACERLGIDVTYLKDSEVNEESLADCDIIYGSMSPSCLHMAKNLKWHASGSAGADMYSKPGVYANEDVILTNSSGAFGTSISEHIIMVTLMLFRHQHVNYENMNNKIWVRYPEDMKSLKECAITVLGTGDLGTEFARRAKSFDPAVIRGVRRNGNKPADPVFDEVYGYEDLAEVLPKTELLVMCMPSTKETTGMINKDTLALLPEGAYLVNVGRGTAIVEADLCDALNSGHLAGAALDVASVEPLPPDNPLFEAKNILLTPHCSGTFVVPYTRKKNVAMFLENLENYVEGKPLKHVIDRSIGY